MKNILAISFAVAISFTSTSSYSETYSLGDISIAPGDSESITLRPLKDPFAYTVTCKITNPCDRHAAIIVNQRNNDFGSVTLDGNNLIKSTPRDIKQTALELSTNEDPSILVINDVNDKSQIFNNDYLNFYRSMSNSDSKITISCTAAAHHEFDNLQDVAK